MLKWHFCSLKIPFSHLEHYQTEKKFQIFDGNHGLTSFEKWTLSHYVKMTFLLWRKRFFPFRTLLNIMSRYFSKKMRLRRNFKFWREVKGQPLRKNGYCPTMLKWRFWSQENPFSYLEHYQTSCLGLFQRKWDLDELSNCWRKSWADPFGKMDIFTLC